MNVLQNRTGMHSAFLCDSGVNLADLLLKNIQQGCRLHCLTESLAGDTMYIYLIKNIWHRKKMQLLYFN